MGTDQTDDRRCAETVLEESDVCFRGLVEGFGTATWQADADGCIVTDSPSWRAYTGQSLSEWLGHGWLDAIHPEDRADTEQKWRAAIASRTAVNSEYRLWHAASASWLWSNVRVVPIKDAEGTVQKWAGVNIDINDRRELQMRYEMLINELQHRSRNLLGVVAAVASRTLPPNDSTTAFVVRLQALSRAQGLLSQHGTDTVEVGALVRMELATHTEAETTHVRVTGPEVHLTAQQVQNFALALHELTTNAVKYGALASVSGHLTVAWEVVLDRYGRRRLALSWTESGVAIDPDKIIRRGYGTELIQEALAYALQAKVDYSLGQTGVRCRIEMPIS